MSLLNPLRRFTKSMHERREHDVAMRTRGVAAEHAVANGRAKSQGEPGCRYCR